MFLIVMTACKTSLSFEVSPHSDSIIAAFILKISSSVLAGRYSGQIIDGSESSAFLTMLNW